ncbi:hypothetical protein LTR36_000526 [Oleoguttula mirabilis]|uniref:Galactose oxidase n=1 Tax=Oleoguttula mirabilis TaxID=1507867 RepID=A0AAV9JQD7_9PEZI|nr:hypothetical protein LTR36_000526 [Oleoguttula mirabilis]
MAETGIAAAYGGIETLVEGAMAFAKGIYDPTLPLKATLTPITDLDVPQAYHTIAVVKGRAYMFGGKTVSKTGGVELADNDMHIVILPSSGVEGADYRRIQATSEAPPPRWRHSAAVVDDSIYIFGGSGGEDGEALDEQGRVWVFDTVMNTWSHLDAHGEGKRPEPRTKHAAVASEHPQSAQRRTDEGVAPQLPMDPAKVVPEPPAADSYGTLIVQGGKGRSGQQLNDMWSFDISSRTWAELPEPPPPTTDAPSLAIVEQRLYTFSKGQTSYLDLTPSSFSDRAGQGELGLAPLGPWSTFPPSASSPDTAHPGDRTGASLIPVTTGQGRHYLLLIGGHASSSSSSAAGEALEDIWALQLQPEGMTAASLKDAARQAIRKATREMQWEEVGYFDGEGRVVGEGRAGRGVGGRKGFAAARGTEVDGASIVLWGGVGRDGKVRGDGVMVTVDR